MCGILACLNYHGNPYEFRDKFVSLLNRLKHRGPDWSGVKIIGNNLFGHQRLSIVDIGPNGDQPLESNCTLKSSSSDSVKSTICIANGEIYNHKLLYENGTLDKSHVKHSESDCEVILHLYEQYGDETPKFLDGDFAFVVYNGEDFLVARDPVGVVSLYQGWSDDGSIWVSSEMKTLDGLCSKIVHFPPGYMYSSKNNCLSQWYRPAWYDANKILRNSVDLKAIRRTLEEAVVKRLMSDVPYGVLLSGGLDSSLIAAIASRKLKQKGADLHTFSIGLKDSPDLRAARAVAKHLGTIHHELQFKPEDGLDALKDVIYHLESYDLSIVRAGIVTYLLARRVKALGFKMVLSGEGADEVFGAYLFFSSAPDDAEFHGHSLFALKSLYFLNCLRLNKSSAAWGLEVRVPFLDKDFLDVSMSIDPKEKMHGKEKRMEKYILRKAFEEINDPYLPNHVLWRQKEQMEDGVGYSWTQFLRDHAERQVTVEELAKAHETYPINTPKSKETYLYRKIFENIFHDPACRATAKCYVPKADWGCGVDTSGRTYKGHAQYTGIIDRPTS